MLAATDPSQDVQVPLHLVLSAAGVIAAAVLAVFQWLARNAWNAREALMQQTLQGARDLADQALSRVAGVLEREHATKSRLDRIEETQHRTQQDVESIQGSMVTREVLALQLKTQTAELRNAISDAVRSSSSGRYAAVRPANLPEPPSDPPSPPPPRPRLPSRPQR